MKLTWYGHSAFRVELGGARILIDPYLTENPSWSKDWEGPAEGITHVLLTHGHGDHIGDAAAILQATNAMLVANFEICMFLVGQGVSQSRINPGNHGGTVDCGGFTTTFVNALHSSSYQSDGGSNTYLGNPAGLVLHCRNEKTLYHMGYTDIFSDMALACERFFNFETVLPCHYGTFGMLDQTADKFVSAMEDSGVDVKVPPVGGSVTL